MAQDTDLTADLFGDSSSPSQLQTALSYARRGWAVLPLHTAINGLCSCGRADCRSPGKHPGTAHGVKDATTNEATIREWWQQHPDANIGIATGAVSGLVVLDVDPLHGGLESLQQLTQQYGEAFLEGALSSLTGGGGIHFYFAHPGVPVQNRTGCMPGLDIRGENGYVVAPFSRHVSGYRYSWESTDHTLTARLVPVPSRLLELIQAPAAPAGPVQDADGRWRISEGARHMTLLSLAGTMRRRPDFPHDAIAVALLMTNELCCVPPLDDAEVLSIAASIMRYPPATSLLAGDGPGAAYGLTPFTDLGNAERLVEQHGEDLLFCFLGSYWLYWNGSRWLRELTGEVWRLAKATVRLIYAEARQVTDKKWAGVIRLHAVQSEAAPRLKALVDLAKFHLPVLPEAFDRQPWLLNVRNGTLDLRTATLREHRREDSLTKMAPVVYDPDAICPRWEAFLSHSMGGDVEIMAYLRRAFGYALTGDTREQVLFLLHGTGANGKSTFLEVLRALLGDYARQTDFSTLLARRSEGIRNDVARLAGARFVTAVEAESGKRLDEPLVKQLTGGDRVTARFLYQEFFEFAPEFKLFLATNHKPVIWGTDNGIWRRIRLIPFEVTIPAAEQDRTLVATLQAELPGILNWAIQGCLDWQRDGLGEPEAVRQATAAYRTEMDILADFLDVRCVQAPDVLVLSSELYQAYQEWCAANGQRPLSQSTLGNA